MVTVNVMWASKIKLSMLYLLETPSGDATVLTQKGIAVLNDDSRKK